MSASHLVDADGPLPRVLVVDDEPDNREVLNLVLEWEGFRVSTAASGTEALAMVAAAPPPDLVLLDVMMPGMTGYEVVAQIKADPVTRGIPVMMISALTDAKSRALALTAGAEDFLSKPIDREELVRRVKNLLAKAFPGRRERETPR